MEDLLNAINYASHDNVADMQPIIIDVIKDKIAEKMQEKRMEIAKTILTKESFNENAENQRIEQYINSFVASKDPNLKGKSPKEREKIAIENMQNFIKNYLSSGDPKLKKLSPQEREKYIIDKFFQQSMHEEYLEEKITKNMSAQEIIDDFVHSNDESLKGKSKQERIQMALGVYYELHPEESKNIKEDLPEIPQKKPEGINLSAPKIEQPKMLKVKPFKSNISTSL